MNRASPGFALLALFSAASAVGAKDIEETLRSRSDGGSIIVGVKDACDALLGKAKQARQFSPPSAGAALQQAQALATKCLKSPYLNDDNPAHVAGARRDRDQAKAAWDAAVKKGAVLQKPRSAADNDRDAAILAFCMQLANTMERAATPLVNYPDKVKPFLDEQRRVQDQILKCMGAAQQHKPEAKQLADEAARGVERLHQLAVRAVQEDDGKGLLDNAKRCLKDLAAVQKQVVGTAASAAIRAKIAELGKLKVLATNAADALAQCRALAAQAYEIAHKNERATIEAGQRKLGQFVAQVQQDVAKLTKSPDYGAWVACLKTAQDLGLRAARFAPATGIAARLGKFQTMKADESNLASLKKDCQLAVTQSTATVEKAAAAATKVVMEAVADCRKPTSQCHRMLVAAIHKAVPGAKTVKAKLGGNIDFEGVLIKGGTEVTVKVDRTGIDVYPLEVSLENAMGGGLSDGKNKAAIQEKLNQTYKFEVTSADDLWLVANLLAPVLAADLGRQAGLGWWIGLIESAIKTYGKPLSADRLFNSKAFKGYAREFCLGPTGQVEVGKRSLKLAQEGCGAFEQNKGQKGLTLTLSASATVESESERLNRAVERTSGRLLLGTGKIEGKGSVKLSVELECEKGTTPGDFLKQQGADLIASIQSRCQGALDRSAKIDVSLTLEGQVAKYRAVYTATAHNRLVPRALVELGRKRNGREILKTVVRGATADWTLAARTISEHETKGAVVVGASLTSEVKNPICKGPLQASNLEALLIPDLSACRFNWNADAVAAR